LIKLTEKLMLNRTQKLPFDIVNVDATLSLPIDMRTRSRARVKLDDGRDAGLFLERGSLVRGGDLLLSDDGLVVKVLAANETVSTVYSENPLQLMRAAYHLGNRHVPLQVDKTWLRYQHDAVLDSMLKQMGLEVLVEHAAFEPEAGAYHQEGEHDHSNLDNSNANNRHEY